jgi:hypothetical protein
MTMRSHPAVLAVAGLLMLATPPAALAVGADTITVRERKVDINPGETNPCTGATGTIIDDEQDVFHITTLGGATHLTGHGIATVSFIPDDPGQVSYTGHETFALSQSSGGRTFVVTSTQNLRLNGSDGTFITLRERSHLTVTPSGATISIDKPTFACS